MAIVKLVVAFFLSLTTILAPYFQFLFKGADFIYEDWSETDEFTADYAFTLKKDPNKDFVIVNFADIQLSDDEIFGEDGEFAKMLIKKSIEESKPDLITLTGDNASGDVTYIELVKYLDSFGIPWAPTMGNHDGGNGNTLHEAWDSYIISEAKNCLYKPGPKGMGNGNYIINITENGDIIHSIFMMDSHSDAGDNDNGIINRGPNGETGYDHLWADQIKWYEWAVKGIEKLAGHPVQSSAFMHIPVIEFRTARDTMCDFEYGVNEEGQTVKVKAIPKAEYTDAFGSIEEGGAAICSPEGNNGFFALAKELGSTKDMIFGHDHKNNMSIVYDGIRLSFSLKSGRGSYSMDSMNGWSTLSIDSDGKTEFAHHSVFDN